MSTSYTPSQIRAAIYRAADRIQRDPSCYNFWTAMTPPECGSLGCMIGWIGFELKTDFRSAALALNPSNNADEAEEKFYRFCRGTNGSMDYHTDAAYAAQMMREFADVRFPVVDSAYEAFRRALNCAPYTTLRITHQRGEVVA